MDFPSAGGIVLRRYSNNFRNLRRVLELPRARPSCKQSGFRRATGRWIPFLGNSRFQDAGGAPDTPCCIPSKPSLPAMSCSHKGHIKLQRRVCAQGSDGVAYPACQEPQILGHGQQRQGGDSAWPRLGFLCSVCGRRDTMVHGRH